MKTLYDTPVDAAKGMRKELKQAFPDIKFSVRTEYFANGNSIDISWELGATVKEVEKITNKYQYGWFDGMTDMYNYEDTLVTDKNGEIMELGGAKFVMAQRNVPNEIYYNLLKQYCEIMNDCYYNEKEPWNSCFKRDGGTFNGLATTDLNRILNDTDFRKVTEYKLIWSEKTDGFIVI